MPTASPHVQVTVAGRHRHERPDLLVHALAQLPDSIELDIRGNGPGRDVLMQLSAAYGLDARIRFDPEPLPVILDPTARRRVRGSMAELLRSLGADADDDEVASCRRGEDELLARHRIAIITNLPTHYRVPLFNRVARRLNAVDARMRVLFTAKRPPSRAWMAPEPIEFDHEMLGGRALRIGSLDVPWGLERRLRSFAPTLVLVPGFSPTVAVRAAVTARRQGVPYGVWSGALATPRTRGDALRRRQRRALLRRASFALSYGHLSAEYMRELAPELPAVYGRNTAPVIPTRSRRRADGARVEVLTVGQAIPRKGLDVAIAAFEQLRSAPCRLTIIGGGTHLEELRRRASHLENVRLLGSIASDQTLQAYLDADIFLFPTRSDVFGLVLVEAMGAGLPTVVSSACGAVADLALHGRNCLVVDGHDPAEWADAIRRLVEDPHLRETLGTEAQETIRRRWTLDHSADAMVAGIRLGVLAGALRKAA